MFFFPLSGSELTLFDRESLAGKLYDKISLYVHTLKTLRWEFFLREILSRLQVCEGLKSVAGNHLLQRVYDDTDESPNVYDYVYFLTWHFSPVQLARLVIHCSATVFTDTSLRFALDISEFKFSGLGDKLIIADI